MPPQKVKTRLLLPTGRMQKDLLELLSASGFGLKGNGRNYRPQCVDPELEVKFLKPLNIPRLVAMGRHELGFCGLDWVREHNAEVEVLLELGLDPVRLVLAAPEGETMDSLRARKNLVLATEYQNISQTFLKAQGIEATVLRTSGTTEVYPPEDADFIVDNTSTGSTLRDNKLDILATLMRSSTCLVADPESLKRPEVREKANHLVTLLKSTLDARSKVVLEMNVSNGSLVEILALLPAMKRPTVQTLAGGEAASVKTVVERRDVRELVPKLLASGASDILEFSLQKVVP